MRRRWGALIAGLAVALTLTATGCGDDEEEPADSGDQAATAEAFKPEGTVNFWVPAPPGGGSDLMVRNFADYYRELGDADVAIENFENYAAFERLIDQHEGDPNYVVGSTSGSSYVWSLTELDIGFDYTSFTNFAVFAEDGQFIVVADDSPYQTYDDLINAAKGETLTVAHAGAGGVNAVAEAQIEQAEGVEFEPVIFESGGEQLQAILGDDVAFAMMEPSEFIQNLEKGDVRAILNLSEEPNASELLADVPVPSDVGLDVDFASQFRAFIGAAGLTPEQTQYWVDQIEGWTQSEAYQQYVEESLVSPIFLGGEEAVSYIETEKATFEELNPDAAR
jgi:putative tricarboxylic transport membrane protein